MKEQHELDRLLKNKFDAREFEFQEAYWEEASSLIAAAEAEGKKPFGFWWRWLVADSAIVLTLLLGIFIFSTPKPNSSFPFLTETYTPSSSTTSKSDQTPTNSSSSSIQKKETSQVPPQSETLATIRIPSSSQPKPQVHTKPTPTKPISNIQSPSPYSTSGTNESNTALPFDSEKGVDNAPTLISTEVKSSLTTEKKEITLLNHLLFTLQAKGLSPEERLLPASQKQDKIKKSRLGLVLGLQSSASFDGTEEKKLSHWPTIGLTYTHGLTSRLKLQSGIMFENRAALVLNKSFTSTQFSFGRNEETTSLLPQHAHYLALPLQVGYRIQKRHSLALGLNTAYLLEVRSTLTTQMTDPLGNLSEKIEKAWGYRQGFQRFDMGLLLGYQFQFSPKMGLMLEAYQGFRDISEDEFWEVARVDKQRQIRFKVYWNLF